MARNLYDNDTFERGGYTFRLRFQDDYDSETPWDRDCMHGPVSDWRPIRKGEKGPGERILHIDHGSARYYDVAAAIKIAKRDGWGLGEDEMHRLTHDVGRKPTAGQIAACAVEMDYDRLRRWCNDLWSYVGVVVTLLDEDEESTDTAESVWGIESDAGDYLDETAYEIADSILRGLQDESTDAAWAASQNIVTVGA